MTTELRDIPLDAIRLSLSKNPRLEKYEFLDAEIAAVVTALKKIMRENPYLKGE